MSFAATRTLSRNTFAIGVATVGTALAVSLFYTPLPVIAVVAIPLCIYFLTRPYELLLLMVFLIPFNFIFEVGSIPVAAELLKVFAWIPFILTWRDRPSFVRSRYQKWLAIVAALLLLSLVRAHDLPFTLKDTIRFGSNIGLVYLCLNLIDTREKLFQVFRVLAVSTFLVAVYGFYQWAIQDFGGLFWIVNPRLDTNLAHYRDEFWEWRNRIISVLTSEMELGHYFNLCIPVGILLWVTEGRRRLSSKWLLMTLCMLLGLVLTFTFGAWLALAATSFLFVIAFGGRHRAKSIVISLLVLCLVIGLLAIGPLRPVIEAKASGTAIGSLAWDAGTRLYGWKLALQLWWQHPFIGAGIGNFEFFSSDFDFVRGSQSQGSTPHQTYLYLLANTGIVGLIAVLAVFIGTIRTNLKLMRSTGAIKIIAWAFAFAFSVNLIGWFSDDSVLLGPHAGYLLWLLVGMAEAFARMVESGTTFLMPSSS